MISVLSNETNTLSFALLWLLLEVSINIKQLPIGGYEEAPLSPVGLFVFVDLIKSYGLPSPCLLLQTIFQFCKRS